MDRKAQATLRMQRASIIDHLIERGFIRLRPYRPLGRPTPAYGWSQIHPLLTPASKD